MYFRKWPHASNFDFVKRFAPGAATRAGRARLKIRVTPHDDDVFHVRVTSDRWKKSFSLAGLQPPPAVRGKAGACTLTADAGFGLRLADRDGRTLLSSPSGMTLGVSGSSHVFVFDHQPDFQFYGMGEKMLGLELSGKQSNFWNTDVFADFYWKEIFDDRPDPMYVSIPYVIIKRGNTYVGLLLDNPHAAFISTGAGINIANQMELGAPRKKIVTIGSRDGRPDLYLIVGPTLPELTRKLQKLVGVTPRPPAWALGYHQCRWGYKSAQDLENLDRKFTDHGIPCDGLWLDIDYMQDFKVFTFNPQHFPNPKQAIRKLRANGRRVVPIIDPGVKQQPGYDVYENGRKADAYCRNAGGREFMGLVWPGDTVFPDFSLPRVRAWWAKQVRHFAACGFEGAWIDMNDPSTGAVLNEDMLFNRGRDPHHTFHNQYALGMAMATRAGFDAAHGNKRTFVISRSGYTGISRHSAIWTGDNCSNYHYLRNSIAVSLNLALSGVPFNGPDIGGFAGDTTAALISDWVKAGFLFPFCRNHSALGTRQQEPWAFDDQTLAIFKHYIGLRYKLRPYLYNLFVNQELAGEAILRPLFHDFTDAADLPLGAIDDQFLVGPSILQAPILTEKERQRDVVLPGTGRWYSALDAGWVKGHRKVSVAPGPLQTPIYFREGSMVPMSAGASKDNAYDGANIELHIFLSPGPDLNSVFDYTFDDGETLDYKKGKSSTMRVYAHAKGNRLELRTEMVRKGFGPCHPSFVVYGPFGQVTVNGRTAALKESSWQVAGLAQPVWRVA